MQARIVPDAMQNLWQIKCRQNRPRHEIKCLQKVFHFRPSHFLRRSHAGRGHVRVARGNRTADSIARLGCKRLHALERQLHPLVDLWLRCTPFMPVHLPAVTQHVQCNARRFRMAMVCQPSKASIGIRQSALPVLHHGFVECSLLACAIEGFCSRCCISTKHKNGNNREQQMGRCESCFHGSKTHLW